MASTGPEQRNLSERIYAPNLFFRFGSLPEMVGCIELSPLPEPQQASGAEMLLNGRQLPILLHAAIETTLPVCVTGGAGLLDLDPDRVLIAVGTNFHDLLDVSACGTPVPKFHARA